MHYKNGREAKDGDQVIGKGYSGVFVGRIMDLIPGQTSCNVSVERPMGLPLSCITVGDLYHAEDALAAIEPVITAPAAAPMAETVSEPVAKSAPIVGGDTTA